MKKPNGIKELATRLIKNKKSSGTDIFRAMTFDLNGKTYHAELNIKKV